MKSKANAGPQFPSHVRLWIWWNGGDVKVTVPQGRLITFWQAGPTDEGYSGREVTIGLEGATLTKTVYTFGRDCDGPLETWTDSEARVGDLVDINGQQRLRWAQVDSRQRDHYAEAMGY